jgi:hypothetical protein
MSVYRSEAAATAKSGNFGTMWNLHALSSVIGCNIYSIYPEYGGFTVRPHANRLVVPRIETIGV